MGRLYIPALLGILGTVGCQPAPQVIVNPNATQSGLTVSGTATVRVEPTHVVIRLGADFTDSSIKRAKEKTESTIKAITAAVANQKVAPEDVQTISFTLDQQWAEPGKRRPWNCRSSLEIRVKDIDKAPDVLEAALAAGANEVQSVRFTVEKMHEVRDKARDQACQAAMAKAQVYGRNFNVKIGRPLSIQESDPNGYNPAANTMNYAYKSAEQAVASLEGDSVLSAGSIEVKLTVYVNYELL
jgi:uncharacterized protein YggE